MEFSKIDWSNPHTRKNVLLTLTWWHNRMDSHNTVKLTSRKICPWIARDAPLNGSFEFCRASGRFGGNFWIAAVTTRYRGPLTRLGRNYVDFDPERTKVNGNWTHTFGIHIMMTLLIVVSSEVEFLQNESQTKCFCISLRNGTTIMTHLRGWTGAVLREDKCLINGGSCVALRGKFCYTVALPTQTDILVCRTEQTALFVTINRCLSNIIIIMKFCIAHGFSSSNHRPLADRVLPPNRSLFKTMSNITVL